MTTGKTSTEHARAWRADALGALIVAYGLYFHDWHLCAIGAALVAVVSSAYSLARAAPKAARERPLQKSAPKEI